MSYLYVAEWLRITLGLLLLIWLVKGISNFLFSRAAFSSNEIPGETPKNEADKTACCCACPFHTLPPATPPLRTPRALGNLV